MAVSQSELAQRLRTAREACGITQDQAAQALGVSRSLVGQMELGNRAVSSIELDRLAYLYGRDLREFVRDEPLREEDPLVALFRAEPDVAAQPQVADALRRCLALGREITALERHLQVARTGAVASYPLTTPRGRWDAVKQGCWAAEEERKRLGIGWTPVGDLVELFETQGVRTALVQLPSDISGLTLNDPTVGTFVVANRDHHYWRRRFSHAHEYGHVLMDRARLSTVSRGSDQDQILEVRANAFAATFLMPEQGVREFLSTLGKGQPSRGSAEVFDEAGGAQPAEGRVPPGSQDVQPYDLAQVAHHFDVSRISALYRLKNLRLVTQSEFERLKATEESGRGATVARLLNLSEPDHQGTRNEFVHRFLGLGLEAYRRELISRAKLYELGGHVELTREQVDRLLSESGLGDDE